MPGWDDCDVVGLLGSQFGVPVQVDNDANLLALGERSMCYPDVDDLIYVKVATGVGAGIFSGGRLVRGADGSAGDFGHVYSPAADQVPCRCGNIGCLEAFAGGLAMAKRLSAHGHGVSDAPGVAELAKAGNLEAVRELREAGLAIGAVLATCVAILNPRVIAVGGEISAAHGALVNGVREAIYRRTTPLAGERLRIELARSGALGGAIGAAQLVLDTVFAKSAIDARFAE
ncbi:MAG: ROK family protein [Propionibacteriaceae bacterium]|jgi:glucokinase|nr:ROK family protein [Propionibacteriaceae bacterium]